MFSSNNQQNQEKENICETKHDVKYYKHHSESKGKKKEINEKEHSLIEEISQIYNQNKNEQTIENCMQNKKELHEREKEFKDPGLLFDFVFSGENTDSELKTILINEIKNIINIMEKILYTPPYLILFGRISVAKPKVKIESNQIEIDQSFYNGFENE